MESRLLTALSRLSREEPDDPDVASALVAFTRLLTDEPGREFLLKRLQTHATPEQMGFRDVGSGPTFAFEDTREHFDPRIELADWFDDAQ